MDYPRINNSERNKPRINWNNSFLCELFFTSVCKYLQLHKFSFLLNAVKFLVVVAISRGKRYEICGGNITLWNQKRPIYVAKGPEKHDFLEIVWSMRCIIQWQTRGIRKRYTFNVNPENVYLPRGRRLRFQLINSKFPAPLSVHLFPD